MCEGNLSNFPLSLLKLLLWGIFESHQLQMGFIKFWMRGGMLHFAALFHHSPVTQAERLNQVSVWRTDPEEGAKHMTGNRGTVLPPSPEGLCLPLAT